jgi:uncharacterized membrane protein YfcA
MDQYWILIVVGFLIGTCGTLIGAGGGFLLVPLLLLTQPELPTETITAVSIAIVAANAISGSVAYARAKRIDYKAGILFALFTIPGSVLGAYLTNYVPKEVFQKVFSVLLLVLAVYLFVKNSRKAVAKRDSGPIREPGPGIISTTLTDRQGKVFSYAYNYRFGIMVSVIVGFISPLLGIGGGIVHVPAMVQWMGFPVYVATATSHFILAIMASITVITHFVNGTYDVAIAQKLVIGLCIGVLPGAQLGAWLSHRLPTNVIIRVLAVCLALVGMRILLS